VRRALGDGIELDDSKERIDRDEVHRFLSQVAYWALGRPRETQDRLIDEAARVVGLYDGDRQIGFCRAATDGTSFVYLADVYVLEEFQKRGLGTWFMQELMTHSDLQGLRRFSLVTRDAHRLYEKCGFAPLANPAGHMEIVRPGLYLR